MEHEDVSTPRAMRIGVSTISYQDVGTPRSSTMSYEDWSISTMRYDGIAKRL